MITFKIPEISIVINSWKQILYIGIPTALTNLIGPVSMGVVTKIISDFGDNGVAGFGVGWRIQMLVMSVVMALSTVLVPFVGQNYGAGNIARIRAGVKISHIFSLLWGAFIFFVFFIFSENIASLFNEEPEIIKTTSMFLIISSVGYGFGGILRLSCASLNALNKPLYSAFLMFFNMVILLIPLAVGLSKVFGLYGIFYALTISYFITGSFSYLTINRVINKMVK